MGQPKFCKFSPLLARHVITDDVHRRLVVGATDFQDMVGQIFIEIKLIERLMEEFARQSEIHPDRPIDTDEPRMKGYVCILPL